MRGPFAQRAFSWDAPASASMYIRQPHAAVHADFGQVVVAFTSQNVIWAVSISVPKLVQLTRQLASTNGPEGSASNDVDLAAAVARLANEGKLVAASIFAGAGISAWPRISPDCDQIAFTNDQSGCDEIYTVAIELVPVAVVEGIFAVQVAGPAERITHLSGSFAYCIGWGHQNDLCSLTSSADPSQSVIRFVSDALETNVALETVWHICPTGGTPQCSGLGEADFYTFCDKLQLHIVGRYTRDAFTESTWKVRLKRCMPQCYVLVLRPQATWC